ncbi:MAG TPA: MtrB/PioB family outer membrane beta-barrel protein [Vicinamibacterales bacterium]|nr:MtrB/PioB family outer membrane beta-barrel protein [Vicinamibacterales bacterium]
MKRMTLVSVLLACGLLATSAPLFAQPAPVAPNWFSGKTDMLLFGREGVDSSKFQEYRDVPRGAWMPVFTIKASHNGNDFALFAENVAKRDQRYSGYANLAWVGVTFDYNQVPHNMGNGGQTLFSETSPGVWSMSGMFRNTLGNAVDAVSSTGRNYAFYSNMLASTVSSAGFIDITALRQRGDVALDLGRNLPFDLTVTYLRELKSGARGASGGDILGVVTSAIDVLEPLDEVTQDFGIRWAYNHGRGNVYATFNRNVFNNRVDSLIVDNPFRATDRAYVSTSVPGGPARVQFSTSPDNEANRGAFGVLFKFMRQTRITADVAFGRWTQNDPFLPFTINTAIITPSGVPATSLDLLPKRSLDGKINTTTVNLAFSSRPAEDLSVRLRYRTYDLTNKTSPVSWVGGSTSGSPDRSWGAEAATADAPYGYATANLYDNTTKRFDAQVGYDIKDLTLEGSFRNTQIDRTHREATSGEDTGFGFAAVYRASEYLSVRGVVDRVKRTADGETFYGFQADEAERETTRTGVDIEVTPTAKFGVNFAYFRRNDDYPNRPDRIAASGGRPVAGAQPIPGTPSGLLEASYDTFTVGFDFIPSERAELGAYYTYEKNAQTNQFSTTTGVNLNNLLNYAGRDKGNTYGLNGVFQLVPDKWTFSMMLQHQKIDGFLDITAREAGTFYTPGRTTLVPPGAGGALDINDFDDTEWTTAWADLAYAFTRSWTFSVGYAYDKYSHADAFSDLSTIFPQTVLFFLNANDGGYTANSAYTKLSWRF